MAVRKLRASLAKADVSVAVPPKKMNWKRALIERPDQAAERIHAELEQIVNWNVCEPVNGNPVEYHRSHDLYEAREGKPDKARLVLGKTVHGGEIDYGIDLYAPTIDTKVLFVVFSLALEHGLRMEVWDVKGAFLKSPMQTEGVYASLAPGVVCSLLKVVPGWAKYVRRNGSMMVRALKAWYGLSAASALWHKELDGVLVGACGYTRHSMIECMYYRIVDEVVSFLTLHVDDIGVYMPVDAAERDRVLGILEGKFERLAVQDGQKLVYIGLEIHWDLDNRKASVGMRKRIESMAKDFNISMPTRIPCNPARNTSFSLPDPTGVGQFADITFYRSLVMTLMYISIVLPECKYHIGHLATKQSEPSVADHGKAVHVAQYMIANKDFTMEIRPMGKHPDIVVFTDAAFDVYKDSKSHGCTIVFVGQAGCAMYMSSRKHHCITRSSTDSEVVDAESGAITGGFYRDFLGELGVHGDQVQYQDNMSVLALATTGVHDYSRRERHMVRRVNFLKDYFEEDDNGKFLLWVCTGNMTADLGTKDLHGANFDKHSVAVHGRTKRS